MPRLPSLSPDQMTPAQARVHASIVSGPRGKSLGPLDGPFAPLLYSPAMAQHIEQLGVYVRYNSQVPRRQRELAICIIAAHWHADFEWYSHAPLAAEEGVPQKALDQIAKGEAPELSEPLDQIIFDFTHALIHRHRVDDATYQRTVHAFGEGGVVDLTGLVGYYTLLAMTLNTFEVDVPEDAEIPWRIGQ